MHPRVAALTGPEGGSEHDGVERQAVLSCLGREARDCVARKREHTAAG
jgi:hypothetical protein